MRARWKKRQTAKKQTKPKPSITAVSVAMALSRSIATDNIFGFTSEEGDLATYLYQIGQQTLRGANWVLAKGVSMMSQEKQQNFFDKKVFPAYDKRIALRKYMIKQRIEAAIAQGVQQVVILGGGFDVRGLYTAANHPNVQVYEVDRGITQDAKINSLDNIPSGIGFDKVFITSSGPYHAKALNNMRFIKADLTGSDWINLLKQVGGFDSTKPAIVIIEGVTCYLDEKTNKRLLTDLNKLLAEGSEVVVSYIAETVYPDLVKKAQSKSGELYQFTISPEDTVPFANKAKFEVTGTFDGNKEMQIIDPESVKRMRDNVNLPIEVYFSFNKVAKSPKQSLADVPYMQVNLPEPEQDHTANMSM